MTRRPRLTVRARLTLLYTALSAACGAIIVAVSYSLVAQLAVTGSEPTSGSSTTFERQCKAERVLAHPNQAVLEKCATYFKSQGASSQRDLTLSHLLQYSVITLVVVIALAAILGWIVAGRVLRPVHQLTAAAREASENTLSARVALRGPRDELRELGETFNEMLDRLQAAFESQRQFIANASHELRTPLAVMRTTVDVVVADPNSTTDDLRGMAADIRVAVDHAEHLIGALLILARNERGLAVREEVDLATAAEDVLDTVDPGDRRIHARLEPAVIFGDPVLAEHLIANLIDNAVRYNTTDGDIFISTSTSTEADGSTLTISNTGAVISDTDIDRMFLPFQRLNDRTSHDGFGLGLAIVASIVAIHRGTVSAHPRGGGGLTVSVVIPSVQVSADPAG
jgi:signal transduction histidine kinase